MTKKEFCLRLHYNGANSYLFVWSLDNMKKIGFNGYVYNFSVGYNATDVHDILDIYKHLMKKKKT